MGGLHLAYPPPGEEEVPKKMGLKKAQKIVHVFSSKIVQKNM